MRFEFDINKSLKNKKKHGIDFNNAQTLWDDFHLVEIPAKKVIDEPRCLVIGKINQKYWSAIIVYRNDKIRLISVRRSTKKEVLFYES